MGRRYFCDYCNRSFLDDINSRKKHLRSNIHLRNRKLHYSKWRDLKTLYEEESQKIECKRFRNGQCILEENCNFTHYSQIDLKMIAMEVERQEKSSRENINLPTVEDWLKTRGTVASTVPFQQLQVSSPANLGSTFDTFSLPPSLRSLTAEDVRCLIQFETWG